MAIPNLPPFYDMPYTKPDGNLTPSSKNHIDNTFQTLNSLVELNNRYISDDGIVIPSKTTTQITALEPNALLGTMWFNTTLNKLQVKTASGTVETITSV